MRLAFYITICFAQLFAYAKANEGKYTVIAPGTIHSNQKYTVAVAVHRTSEPCQIKVGINGTSYNEIKLVEVSPKEVKNVEFDLPSLEKHDYYLTAESVNCLENFKNSTKLENRKFHNHMRIQTDKGVYKSGDEINFRVLFMDKDLKPVEPEKNAVIWFQDGKFNKIKESEKKNFATINGVYTGKFRISHLLPNGYWRLYVQNGDGPSQYSMFLVDNIRAKYVARVEATDATFKDTVLQVVVTANHVSGKPLDGKVTISLSFDNTHVTKNANMIKGISKIDIDVKEYKSHLSVQYPTLVIIDATIEEQSTGDKIVGRANSHIYPYRYAMHCVDKKACSTFEGGKEKDMLLQITSIDGSNLNDTTSTVELTYKVGSPKCILEPHNSGVVKGHMNETGFVNFKIPLSTLLPHNPYNCFYTFKIKYLEEERDLGKSFQQNEPKRVETLNVAGEYFILMNQFSNNKLHLNKAQKFTVNSSQPLSYFNYNVIGRGNILQSGHVDLPDKPKVYDLTLTPQSSWASDFAVYVYYVDENGEYHYDEKKYHIDEPLNPITVTATEHVKPGANVTIKIRTSPNSFIGVMAIDQRVLLLERKADDLKYRQIESLRDFYNTATPHQGGYSKYPGETSGCVTLTNADYFYDWIRPISHQFQGFDLRLPVKTAVSTSPSTQSAVGPDDANNEDFLKTWFFNGYNNNESEELNISIRTPDISTTWVLTAFSLNPSTGLGIAEHETKITTFQPLA